MNKKSIEKQFITIEQNDKAGRHEKMFISRKIITSKAFLSLSTAAACQVYMIFLNKCRWEKVNEYSWQITNNSEIEFTYDEAEETYGITAGKFIRAIDQLVEVGFIDIAKTGNGLQGDKSLYAISKRWEKFGADEFVKKKRPKRTQLIGFKKKNLHGQNCRKRKKS